ncbi:hypothetical protein BCR33DRAFT_724731 [Rhizoclosmatium globosum]|uniref:Uncharacterized protein n=1 Tax=Rhizoclosmatium globosum TaxID=329046 RepID=A0A1Y2B3A6_9FUNG|nr:hypothetical protein BCR33DRAFT_724731 [Rhizoclosmatium globosum]|eukprot:ORY29214.1 hypothetical protein BCR33DRAFT_724731 [Rhizoclosmatium globosum]
MVLAIEAASPVSNVLDLGHGNTISYEQIKEIAAAIFASKQPKPTSSALETTTTTSSNSNDFVEIDDSGMDQSGPSIPAQGQSLNSILTHLKQSLESNRIVQLEVTFKTSGKHFISIIPSSTNAEGPFYRIVHSFQSNHAETRSVDGDTEAQQRILQWNSDMSHFEVNSYKTGAPIPLRIMQHDKFHKVLKEILFKMPPGKRVFAAGASAASITFAFTLAAVLMENNKLKSVEEKAGVVAGQTARAAAGGIAAAKVAVFVGAKAGAKAVVRNAARSGAAFTGVITAIDLVNGAVHYAIGKSSFVEFRKDAISNVGGAAGGLVGYIAATATAAALLSNPLGWGVIGVAVEEAIWSSELDSLDHLFWYFKLGELDRDANPLDQLCAVGLEQLSTNVEERLTAALPTEDQEAMSDYRKSVMGQYLMLLQLCCPDYFGAMADISEALVQQSEL